MSCLGRQAYTGGVEPASIASGNSLRYKCVPMSSSSLEGTRQRLSPNHHPEDGLPPLLAENAARVETASKEAC